MFEQISGLVKEYGQEAVVDNPAIPNSQNNAVLAEATSTVTTGFQNLLAGGGLQDVLSLFTGGGNHHAGSPIVSTMVGDLVNKLISKFNMSPSQASSVSNSLIPNVLNGLITRTTSTDPSNSAFDLNNLIGSLTGGNVATKESGAGGFDFQGLLNQLTGGGSANTGGGGGFNLDNIISQVTQGAQQHQEQQSKSEGGITDLIKGFFN